MLPLAKKHKRNTQLLWGLTLFEVLISALIFTFLIIGITVVLNIGDWAFPTDTAWVDLQQQARMAMALMTKELREANNIPASFDSDNITFNTVDKSGIHYYRDGTTNQLKREYPTGATPTILANYITYLRFIRPTTNPIFQIEIKAGQTVREAPLSFPLTEQVRLRNE